jgi:hypothetical protein
MQTSKKLSSILEHLNNFSEFELALANIQGDKEKGDLFELFCKAYLVVIHSESFKFVKLFREVEPAILHRLNLKIGPDYGIDLIALTEDDKIWTIQSKYRRSENLSWSELSTFKAASEKADFRLVMGNINQILHPHLKLTDFASVLNYEFQKLTSEDFELLRKYLNGQKVARQVYAPRDYQKNEFYS